MIAERFAAAAALYDNGPLLALQRRPETETETRTGEADGAGGAQTLAAAVVLALLWSNLGGSYAAFWHARVALTAGPWTLGADLRTWVDEGLMTLAAAAASPVTWGIILAYVVGKPVGILVAARGRAGLGRAELRGTALTAGVGFTVSLLIASRAFHGALLDQAKVGILATALIAPVLAAAALAPLRPAATPCPAC